MRTITSTTPGPVHLSVDLGPGSVSVEVDDRQTAEITLTPVHAGDNVAADLIDRATAEQVFSDIAVTVPRPEFAGGTGGMTVVRSGRGVTVTQSYGVVTGDVTGVVIVDGNVYVGGQAGGVAMVGAGGKVRAKVRLPLGSSMAVNTTSADTLVDGDIEALKVTSQSGSVVADTVGLLTARTQSGSVTAAKAVTSNVTTMSGSVDLGYAGTTEVKTMSGGVWLTGTTGTQARVSTMSGAVRVRAHHDGHVSVSTMSGAIEVSGHDADVTTRLRSMSGRIRTSGTR